MANKAYLRVGDDYLSDAKPYNSKTAAIAAYREIAQELNRYGQSIDASIHLAESADEIAEYPDFVLSLGARGGVRIENA